MLLVVEGNWLWYRRNWKATVVSSVLQPLLFLLAFGVALGSLVPRSELTGGESYLVFLAPALLVMAGLQQAVMASSWPIVSGFKWQRTYWSVTASPITATQLLLGEQLWVAARLASSATMYLLVVVLFGGAAGWGVLPGPLFAVLCGLAVSPLMMALAATIADNPGPMFNAVLRFVVLPMSLFSGTFFPVSRLPEWGRPLAWVSPLWHGVELSRGAALGTLRLVPAIGHIGYLIGLFAVGLLLASWRFARRLEV